MAHEGCYVLLWLPVGKEAMEYALVLLVQLSERLAVLI